VQRGKGGIQLFLDACFKIVVTAFVGHEQATGSENDGRGVNSLMFIY
jgi:hypothetical protein